MPLVENTLWGERDKVAIAVERLRQFEPKAGYYLAFSGGKDSITIHRLAELAGVQFDAHYNVTTVDPPELVKFIKTRYPHVERHRPEMTMFQLILHKKWPPMRQKRYCCEWLKEKGGGGRVVVTGIRWEESGQRKNRKMMETCYRDRTKIYLNPIIDWTSDNVWEFILQENLEYCRLYDEGFWRLGCVLCPMTRTVKRDVTRWPNITKAYVNTFDKVIRLRNELGLKCTFETGQELFDWWTQREARQDPQEARLFD